MCVLWHGVLWCAGADLIHHSWIDACEAHRGLVPLAAYRLPNGPSYCSPFFVFSRSSTSLLSSLSSSTSLSASTTPSRTRIYNTPSPSPPPPSSSSSSSSLALSPKKIFAGKRFVTVGDETLGSIIAAAGGQVVAKSDELMGDLKAAMTMTMISKSQKRLPVDYVVFEPSAYIESVIASKASSSLSSSSSSSSTMHGGDRLTSAELSAVEAMRHVSSILNVAVRGVHVVSIEWVRDCLVNEQILPPMSHPMYQLPEDPER